MHPHWVIAMPLTILVVDDDEGTRLSISDYLELAGYSVVTATNGWEALRQVQVSQPQLVIADITMPQMDGYEFIQTIRQKPAFRLLPVVFLTARTATQERIRGYQLGCDAYLPKPFELEELGAVIRNLLERTQIIQTAWLQQSHAFEEKDQLNPTLPPEPLQELEALGVTPREKDVLTLISEGLSNAQIGDRLYLSPRTVEKYVSSLFRKTDTSNRAELVRFAIDHHLVT